MLASLPREAHPHVLVGFETADDAGVYQLAPDLALVQTVDFFTPIVDDPFTYGAIAACNALSDIYAMGAKPLTALSILAWPGAGDVEDLEMIVQGGAAKMKEAACVVLGGHSITDAEIKFGYAVSGIVHPDRVRTNAAARAGDVLALTKPLGTGVIATALKQGVARDEDVRTATESMLTLNRAAAEALEDLEVHGLTDVTGFGLLGHAREMAVASRVTLEFDSARIPFFPGAVEYARAGAIAAGLKNNREYTSPCVEGSSKYDDLLYDPQTSGGLLIALAPQEAAKLAARLPAAVEIGRVRQAQGKPLRVQ